MMTEWKLKYVPKTIVTNAMMQDSNQPDIGT